MQSKVSLMQLFLTSKDARSCGDEKGIYRLLNIVLAFLGPVLIVTAFYKLEEYVPFGTKSLATMDAYIQYLDLFSYLKDIINGKNNIAYSFSKGLGDSCVAVFSYYLTSPLNIFVIFFDKENLQVFFHLIIALKLGVCSATMYIYLRERCKKYIDNSRKEYLLVLLSICYGMCQYNIAQCSNIMWIDGVYMLPLIALALYRLIYKEKAVMLSVVVGLAIVFNWYTAGINCLFSGMWFVAEMCIYLCEDNAYGVRNIKCVVRNCIRYVIHMIFGVMFSAFLFLPTIMVLQSTGRGSLDWKRLVSNYFFGNILNVIKGYSIGSKSSLGNLSLYCGALVIVGLILFFFSKNVNRIEKIVISVVTVIMVIACYWNPLFVTFSLFKDASSYWYRFSYLIEFLLVFVAAQGVCRTEKINLSKIWKCIIAFSVLILFLNYYENADVMKNVYLTIVMLFLSTVFFCGAHYGNKDIIKLFMMILLGFVVIVDLYEELSKVNTTVDDPIYKIYCEEHEQEINKIMNLDKENYRIAQTYTRANLQFGGISLNANYNEALAFNYMSIASYTSSPEEKQRTFLDRAGYRICGDNMCVVNTSIVGLDSLLSTKYILSDYKINGYNETGEERVYQNPYWLPMAFKYKDNDVLIDSYDNPFEYQNQIYSALVGEYVQLYFPVQYSKISDSPVSYEVIIPDGNYAVYGNLPYNSDFEGVIDINGIYSVDCAKWIAPSVFYIPTSGVDTYQISVTSGNYCDLKYGEEQFYAIDLDLLAEITEKIRLNSVDEELWKNRHVKLSVESEGEENVFLSIVDNPGWEIKVNGKKIEWDIFADCFISVPLDKGNNDIELTYRVRGFVTGMVLSILTVMILTGECLEGKIRKQISLEKSTIGGCL